MRKKHKKLILKYWREWFKPLLIVVVVLTAFRSSVADWNDVPTGSMKPTILEGDRIFVNKLAYDLKLPFTTWHLLEWDHPERGDVVVCYSPDNGMRLVKRVIGLGGDKIEIRNNRLIINGQRVSYNSLDSRIVNQIPAGQQSRHIFAAEKTGKRTHPIMITPGSYAPRHFGPITVPQGQYLMLGDNRDQSRDSRSFGCVGRNQIVGRAVGVAMSFDPQKWHAPRWERFFKGLP